MSNSSSLQTNLTANIWAKLKGDDPGRLILGVLSVVLIGLSLYWEADSPSFLSRTVGIVGLGVFVALVIRWFMVGSNVYPSEGVPMRLEVDTTCVTVDTYIRDPREAARYLRAAIQGRHPLPAPYGEVTTVPQDKDSLRVYTQRERDEILRITNEAIEQHDRMVLRQIEEVEQQLPS